MSAAARPTHRIITFYSYKGGVGRSMALANVAALLASRGSRVLIVDFDLEAPGLERYFEEVAGVKLSPPHADDAALGLVDMFGALKAGDEPDWNAYLTRADSVGFRHPIDILGAGWRSASTAIEAGTQPAPAAGPKFYAAKLQDLDWAELFAEHGLGDYLCTLREEWRETYDFVLVDSRTGMSDIGGLCTILLPDALVVLFTTNRQSIEGTAEIVRLARAAQETLPVERSRLLAIPMLSRDERRAENERSKYWREIIAGRLETYFRDWVWQDVSIERVLNLLYLPAVPYWSFGESLPVMERPDELDDPGSLPAAYAKLATLIERDLNWEAIEELGTTTTVIAPVGREIGAGTGLVAPSPSRVAPLSATDARPSRSGASPVFKWMLAIPVALLLLGLTAILTLRPGSAPNSSPAPTQAPTKEATKPSVTSVEDAQNLLASPSATGPERIAALASLVQSGSVPRNAVLTGMSLAGSVASLPGCLTCTLDGATLEGMTFDNGLFLKTSFVGAKLARATFIASQLETVDMSKADLTDVNFAGAKFSNVRMDGARLRASQLSADQRKAILGTPAWITTAAVASPATQITKKDQIIGGDRNNGWDIDVFWCEGPGAAKSYPAGRAAGITLAQIATSGVPLGPRVTLGRVRLRMLSLASRATGGFLKPGTYVVEDGGAGERDAANQVAARLSRTQGTPFGVRTSLGVDTQFYLSVFTCPI